MSFSVESVVGRHHEYKDMWMTVVGEELSCKREPTNEEISLLLVIIKGFLTLWGPYPGKYLPVFLRRSGSISCCVTGSRQYSSDLS